MELHECYRILEKQKELKIQYCEKHNLPIPEFTTEDDYWVPVERKPVKEYVEVVHGKWIKITGMAPPEHHGLHYCSVCNEPAPRDKHFREMLSDYCPSCGAKMDGE